MAHSSDYPSDRPTNDVTELAKERNRQAIERTLLSWINSALLLLGLGIFLGTIPTELQPVAPLLSVVNRRLILTLSLGAIASGLALLGPMVVVYRSELRALARGDYLAQPPRRLNLLVMVTAVILFGLVALVDVALGIPWL